MSQSLRNSKKMMGLRNSETSASRKSSSPISAEELFVEGAGEELSVADLEEFREFMASGEGEPAADPVFKEKLRRDLWWTMISRLAHRGKVPDS